MEKNASGSLKARGRSSSMEITIVCVPFQVDVARWGCALGPQAFLDAGIEERRVSLKENVMPQTPHIERHFTAGETVRDIVIGMSDGLTVPFALAAGLTGAIGHVAIIVTAGLAEIAAGSIAMGLGGYLAAKSDAEHYANEREGEK